MSSTSGDAPCPASSRDYNSSMELVASSREYARFDCVLSHTVSLVKCHERNRTLPECFTEADAAKNLVDVVASCNDPEAEESVFANLHQKPGTARFILPENLYGEECVGKMIVLTVVTEEQYYIQVGYISISGKVKDACLGGQNETCLPNSGRPPIVFQRPKNIHLGF